MRTKFDDWWDEHAVASAKKNTYKEFARGAWEAAWDQQQRVIDEMHLMFKDHVLVPKEPTTAMEEAFLDIYERRGWFMRGYKNMIKAAQEKRDESN